MFIERHAKTMHLAGSVRNLHDGTVEIDVQGTEKRIEELIQLARQGPPRSKVTGLAIQERKPDAGLKRFNILF